jgi:hypothetical protein
MKQDGMFWRPGAGAAEAETSGSKACLFEKEKQSTFASIGFGLSRWVEPGA